MRFKTSVWFLALLAAVTILLPTVLLAQSTTNGAISGTVTDPSGAVLPGLTVTLKSTEKGFTQEAKTNTQGFYQFTLVEPGTYTVTISAAGFKTSTTATTPVGFTASGTGFFTCATGFATGPLISATTGTMGGGTGIA